MGHPPTLVSAADELDAAETTARQHDSDGDGETRPDILRFLTAVHALRQIERAVISTATNLGGREDVRTATAAPR